MSLQRVDTPSYLRRYSVFVDSADHGGRGQWDIDMSLDEAIQNVVAIELVGWNIPKLLCPTFIGRYIKSEVPFASTLNPRGSQPGNCVFDLEVTDVSGVNTITVPVDLEIVQVGSGVAVSAAGRLFTSSSQVVAIIAAAIPDAVDAAGDAVINSTTYEFHVGVDSQDRFYCYAHVTGDSSQKATVRFLFATGVNASDSPHRVLAMPAEDTEPSLVHQGVQARYAIDLRPFRYIDVVVDQFPELQPLGRIFVSEGLDFVKPLDPPDRIRLLTRPLRRLESMRVRLVMPDGKTMNPEVLGSFDLEFEVICLQQEQSIPNWVNQILTL